MKRIFLILLIFATGCLSLKVHYVSPKIKQEIKEPFNLKVSSEPQFLQERLKELASAKFSLISFLLDSADSGTIEISFKTKQNFTVDKDGKSVFATNLDVLPKKRHIFQSSQIELQIFDKNKNLIYKSSYKYEGRNDYKVDYSQTPEKAMEECLDIILEKLGKDLK